MKLETGQRFCSFEVETKDDRILLSQLYDKIKHDDPHPQIFITRNTKGKITSLLIQTWVE